MSDVLYNWLLLLHIVAAMVWVGGAVLLGVQATQVTRRAEPESIARFVGSLRVLGPLVLAPATVAVLGFGVGLVLEGDAWSFDQFWVQLGLALFATAFVLGAAHQSRTALGAERAVARQDHAEALRQLTRWAWGYGVIVLLLLAIAWDMVFKPGL